MLPRLIVGIVPAVLLALSSSAWGQIVPKGFQVPDSTLSPDHRYGVTVPLLADVLTHGEDYDPPNSVIDMKTGRLLAIIRGAHGWDRMNHGGVVPARWSPDGSLLLWSVEGKWSVRTLVLLKIEQGKVKWQIDVLQAAQQAILTHTKEAVPKRYAAAKKATAGSGSAYPEGFTVDAQAIGVVKLPLEIDVDLTSNPKIPDPGIPQIDSHLEGLLNARGRFVVTSFHLGRGQPRNW